MHLAFKRWAHIWSNHYLILKVDNKGTLYALKKGLSTHPLANAYIHHVLWAAALYNIEVHPVYVTSAENVVADGISRLYETKYYQFAGGRHLIMKTL